MPDTPYSNREQDARHEQLVRLLNEIKEQTTKTNGRVTDLERKESERVGVSAALKVVFGSLAAILVAYLGYIGVQVNHINTTLSAYEISIQ